MGVSGLTNRLTHFLSLSKFLSSFHNSSNLNDKKKFLTKSVDRNRKLKSNINIQLAVTS